MENFILYEEIGRGSHSIVYKGRRKGTINFLAILCIEKCKRAAITNWVRLTHEIECKNIVQFHEWYETTNHLWMVVELCTGGTLDKVLSLDNCLPEDVIRNFGKDIAAGLYSLHQIGIIFANLCPKKILLDGPGILKLTNFGLARLEGENLSEVYEQAVAQHQDNGTADEQKWNGNPEYQAPEVLKGDEPSKASDIWSFGILLYHMHAGSPPFKGENLAEIVQRACHEKYEAPDVSRRKCFTKDELPTSIRNEKCSTDILNLISGLLQKEVENRFTWDQILSHPFWKGKIDVKNDLCVTASVSNENEKENAQESALATSTLSVKNKDTHRKSQVFNSSSEHGTSRLSTAPERVDALDSTFTLSSRPHTAVPCRPESRSHTPSPDKSMGNTYSVTKQKLPQKDGKETVGNVSSVTHAKQKKQFDSPRSNGSEILSLEDVKDLIYHSSDMEISVIQDNPQIIRVEPLVWDSKSLGFHSLHSVDGVTPDELFNHMKDVIQALSQNPGLSAKVKTNIVTYLAHLCTTTSAVANFTVNSQLLHLLANLTRHSTQHSSELGFKAARAIGLASCCATELEYGSRVTEIFSALTDTIRENFRNTRLKLNLLPSLGQLLFLVAEQEEGNLTSTAEEDKRGNWTVPSSTYMLFTRCLREGEDPIIQHIACKTIEGVVSKTGSHRKRFLVSSQQQGQGGEVTGALLWSIANRAPSECLKQTAMSALCRLNHISGNGSVFQGVLDKVGLPGVLSTLSRSNVRCVQSLISMFVENLHSASKGQANRLAAGRDLLPGLMKYLESPSTVVRAKVFLSVLMLMRRMPEALLTACQNKLVMYIERDSCKKLPLILEESEENYPNDQAVLQPPNSEYMQSALNLLIRHILSQCPPVMCTCVSLLEETSGRKHPSTNHVKQLKACLPTCVVLTSTVTSHVFREQLVTFDFIKQLGCLLSHATKFLQQQNATAGIVTALGEDVTQSFVDSVLTIVESLSQHPLIITQHESATLQSLVPGLIILLGVYNKDGKAVCIKLLDDILGTLLHHRALSCQEEKKTPARGSRPLSSRKQQGLPDEHNLCDLIVTNLLPEYQPILLGHNPLPAYGTRLLSTLLEHWPKLAKHVYDCGLITILLQVLSEQQSCVLGSCAQGIASLLLHLVKAGNKDIMNELYENGLIEHVISHMVEVSCQYMEAQELEDISNITIATEGLINLLLLLKEMLLVVTGEVRNALHMKDAPNDEKVAATDNAERLLVVNKPLTELQGICIQMLCDEQEISDLALNNFSMLVQLFGGDHPDTMADENMECLAEALLKAQPKQQKILLKIIKRVVTLNEYHADHVYSGGADSSSLFAALRQAREDAERRADLALSQLAHDIVACVEGRGCDNR